MLHLSPSGHSERHQPPPHTSRRTLASWPATQPHTSQPTQPPSQPPPPSLASHWHVSQPLPAAYQGQPLATQPDTQPASLTVATKAKASQPASQATGQPPKASQGQASGHPASPQPPPPWPPSQPPTRPAAYSDPQASRRRRLLLPWPASHQASQPPTMASHHTSGDCPSMAHIAF